MVEFFLGLAVVVITCVVLGLLVRLLKQPLIIAYIITGILLGPLIFKFITKSSQLDLFAEIGLAFLLFIVGLNMNFKSLKQVGKTSLISGFLQVFITTIAGFIIGRLIGLNTVESLYVAIALSFSSTIIVVKLLIDKNDLETLYGKVTIGLLLVQDFLAILTLVLVTGIAGDSQVNIGIFLLKTVLKAVILFLIAFFLYETLVPKLFFRAAKSNELLFMTGVAWCFGLAVFSMLLGFSIEIGAFLAGVTLAALPYTNELSSKIRPLRDFFIAIFFVNLGLQMVPFNLGSILLPAFVLTIFVLIGKPLILIILMGLSGYKKRTGFLTGLSLAQISEFSLILVALGSRTGHLSDKIVSLITIVGILTITLSSYMIMYSEKLYVFFSSYLRIFERKNIIETDDLTGDRKKKYDIVVCGAHRMGHGIIKSLNDNKNKDFLVVDFNPDIIKKLERENVSYMYGDISDTGVIEKLAMYNPKIVISTIPIYDDNLLLINKLKNFNKDTFLFVTAKNIHDALELYRKGADMVIFPEILAGQKVADYLKHLDVNEMKRWGRTYYNNLLEYHA